MRLLRCSTLALALLALAACADEPPTQTPSPEPKPKPAPQPVGVYELTVTGLGTSDPTSTLTAVGPTLAPGVSASMANAGAGITFEQVSSVSLIEGSRTGGGQRYASFTYRVRNGTGVSLNNLTLMMVTRANTISGTPISSLKKFDGTDASPSIAQFVIPTGNVTMANDLVTMQAPYPDVLQVITEPEAAAITLPGDVTGIFPYGYVVRSALSNANRTLPATSDPNQWDGLLTVSFRLPLQATSQLDVFSIGFQILAVTDTEVRLTESIEESQDTAAVRRLRDRATALGATTVTVLNGSPAMDPAVPDYPGQRQICYARTAGPAGAATVSIGAAAAYSRLMVLMPGESVNDCAANFRSGTPSRPATNVPFTVTVKAMDRYGNVKSSQADSVYLVETNGVPATMGAGALLVSGSADQLVTYTNYGSSMLRAQGRRLNVIQPVTVAGVTRTWTAGAGTTDWHTNGNWSPAAVPMSLDSVYVPAAAPLDPVLAANVSIGGVTVENVAMISLNAFDLTASANVTTGLTGGIVNTSGRLFLSGIAKTVEGKLPPLRVTGTYSLTNNVNARASIQVDAGRLTVSGVRLQADAN
ncbi:MAG TPA: hypothetical protein VF092_11005 [Longimicrobium sp.]